MISRIEGKVVLLNEKFAVIDVSGIGYKINLSPDMISKLAGPKQVDTKISFWTHLNVKEDALDLYGFENLDELEFFEMLINISGIGPRSALGVIGVAPIETIKSAIASGDTSYMTKVSGVGKKTAEKIILELRDKLSALGHKTENSDMKGELDALEALKSLGYSQAEARDALRSVGADITGVSARVKEALKILSQK